MIIIQKLLICVFFCTIFYQTTSFNKHFFLTQNESTVYYPHRFHQKKQLVTYAALGESIQQSFALNSILQIADNFQNAVDILPIDQDLTHSSYACSLNRLGFLIVEIITQQKNYQYFKLEIGLYGHQCILLSGNVVFLFNDTHYMLCNYDLYTKKVNKTSFNFTKKIKKCVKIDFVTIVCWDEIVNQIVFNGSVLSHQQYVFAQVNEQISFISGIQNQVFVVGGKHSIWFYVVHNEVAQLIDNYKINDLNDFIYVLGGSYDKTTMKLAIILTNVLKIYDLTLKIFQRNNVTNHSLFRIKQLNKGFLKKQKKLLKQSFVDQEVNCTKLINIQFIENNILLQCQATNRTYIYDQVEGQYFPIPVSKCYFMLAQQYLYELCDKVYNVRSLNFYSLLIHSSNIDRSIFITVNKSDQPNFNLRIQIIVVAVKMDEVYVNQQLQAQFLQYSDPKQIQIKQSFKGSQIVAIKITPPVELSKPIFLYLKSYLSVYSLFVLQKCVQIVHLGNGVIYRVLNVISNQQNYYYIEECTSSNFYLGCQFLVKKNYPTEANFNAIIVQKKIAFLHIEDSKLFIEQDNILICLSDIIFNESVISYVLVSSWGIQVVLQSGTYIVFVDCFIQTNDPACIVRHDLNNAYNYQSDSLVIYDSHVLTIYKPQKSIYYNIVRPNQSIFVAVYKEQFYFTNNTHLFKISLQSSIPLFVIPYRQTSSQVFGPFLIAYQPNSFDVYDLREPAFSFLLHHHQISSSFHPIITETETLFIYFAKNTLQIMSNCVFQLGPFPQRWDLLYQSYEFKVEYIRNRTLFNTNQEPSNALISSFKQNASQIWQIGINYGTTQINIDCNRIKNVSYPSQCFQCQFLLNENHFLGHVFQYYDMSQSIGATFTMRQHMQKNENCNQFAIVNNWNDQGSNGKVLFNNKTLMVENNTYPLQTSFCWKYIQKNQSYIVICDKIFAFILDKKLSVISHGFSPNDKYSISVYDIYLYLFVDQNLQVYEISDSIQLKQQMQLIGYSLTHLLNNSLILSKDSICIYKNIFLSDVPSCFLLAQIIPAKYFFPSYIKIIAISQQRFLLFSQSSKAAHLQLTMICNDTFSFKIQNTYAGYLQFSFARLIGVLKQNESIPFNHLIIEYVSKQKQYFMAYYPYNLRNDMGPIRYATQMEQGTNYGVTSTMVEVRGSECISYNLYDKVVLKISYEDPPSTMFAVIRARNSISQGTLYTRLLFQPLTTPWYLYFVSILGGCLFFTILGFLLSRVGEDDFYKKFEVDVGNQQTSEQLPSSLAHSSEL